VKEEALDAYLQGRFYWNRRGVESLTRAVSYFEQAIQIEPRYAAAYAGLADTYMLLGSVGAVMRPTEAMGKAKVAAQQAIAIDDTLSEAHTSLAMLHFWYDWDWSKAESEFKARDRPEPQLPHRPPLVRDLPVLDGTPRRSRRADRSGNATRSGIGDHSRQPRMGAVSNGVNSTRRFRKAGKRWRSTRISSARTTISA
jgi:tetratricopeptide (TPR) repeat protein